MRWLYRNLWLPPLLFALVVLVAGLVTYRVVDRQLSDDLAEELDIIRDGTASALSEWMSSQERAAETAANALAVRRAATELVALLDKGANPTELASSRPAKDLAAELATNLEHGEFESYALVVDWTIVASPEHLVGRKVPVPSPDLRQRLLRGETVLSPPSRAGRLVDASLESVMWVATPIRDPGVKKGIVYLVFRIDPSKTFTRLLRGTRFGETGETFAFNNEGFLVSYTRMADELRELGLLDANQSPILRVQLRDPGVELARGGRPSGPISELPLTRMAASAMRGERNVDVAGYRDFRGVVVVGAWTWLPRYQLGIATELDRAEAYRTLQLVRNAISGLVGVLLLGAAIIAIASRLIAKQRSSLQKAERLGQYTLEERIGQGGMGTVYRARHSFLRRPTALKVLRSEGITDADRARFEREVQATSRLTHPNTIAIYDYGRTASGVFYYAMEYIEGITLAALVAGDGPQPQGRVLFILRQICGSLSEAHHEHLVHRDIKPHNVMLCARGGLFDVVKVLDFGLVKSMAQDVQLTASNMITGTPHYMAPEAIQNPASVDARSDVYAVAAVGFYLLTGREVFESNSLMGVLTRTMTEDAPRPSSITTEPIHRELEALLLECLERSPEKRPSSAAVLLARLDALKGAPELAWPQSSAEAWWKVHDKLVEHHPGEPLSTTPTLAIDVAGRVRSDSEEHITGREATVLMERDE